MLESVNIHEPLLVNSIGHGAGLVFFTALAILFLRDRRGYRAAIAATLALLWNLGSLAVLAGTSGLLPASHGIATLSFAVLSLLPAVLLHLSLEPRPRLIWIAGYVVSAVAVALHLAELATPDATRLHVAALWVIIAGFGALSAATMFVTLQRGRRVAGSMCLFLFAISFVHFGPGDVRHAWSGEIALHHAGIPLALYVLLQDYRFLLLDTYLRFIVNSVVACGFVVLSFLANEKYAILPAALDHPFLQGILLVGACLTLVALIFVRGKLQLLLTRVVFRRPDREPVAAQIRQVGITVESERSFLEKAAPLAAEFVGAGKWEVRHGKLGETPEWVEASVPIRFAKGDSAELLLGRREGGRRYLSEDLNELASLSAVIVEQVERMRNSEIQRLVSQAELRALQSQINPHFLFNSLNTLYGSIPRAASEARKMVLNLAEIFRYFLQSDRTFIQLSEELQIVRAYLQIEALRLGDKLKTEIVVDHAAERSLIPILSIQPLVENAVKHGIAARSTPGTVRLHARALPEGIRITVSDDGEGFHGASGKPSHGGHVGLDNVRQRLRLCFGEAALLQIESSDHGSTVSFLVPSPVAEGVTV
jgi:two-component system, LytTR family, sensor kinase